MMIISMIPNEVTYEAVRRLRLIAERGSDAGLYKLVAHGFDCLNMPAAAANMRLRSEYYKNLER